MHLLHAANLFWALPISGLILLLYVLKLKRKDVVVSSTFLWRDVIRDVQANSPFQRLRKNLLLLLQLILAAMLVLAVARPFARGFAIGGRNMVLIVDSGATMRATDVKPNRLEIAKREARNAIDEMKPGDQMMLVSAYSRPEALTGFTSDRTELDRALDGLRPHDTPTAMRDALNLAGDLVAARRGDVDSGRIELISDGAFANGNGSATANLRLGRTSLAYKSVGSGRDNVGITALDVRPNLGDPPTEQLLVVTKNFGDRPRSFTEEIRSGDNLIEAHDVTLAPGADGTETYDLPEPSAPVTLQVHLDITDDLAADNDAALVVRPRPKVNVLLVGPEDLFLQNAIQSDPSLQLSRATTFIGTAGFDVVVFEDRAPEKLPVGNYLFLHCVSDRAPVKVDGEAESVGVADWERDSPVLRCVDLGSERFGSALKATILPWARELAVGDSGALIAQGERGGSRSLFFAFALHESLLPLRVAFPILVSNSIRWLALGDSDLPAATRTGVPFAVPAPNEAKEAMLVAPDGAKRKLVADERGDLQIDGADIAGVYTLEAGADRIPFAVNVADACASDIHPQPKLAITDRPQTFAGRRVEERRDLLPYILIPALALLTVEWWVFHRRVLING